MSGPRSAPVAPLVAHPIGTIRSPWPARFGIPRQAGLVADEAAIELFPERCPPATIAGLERFSHVWVIAWLHAAPRGGATVRPPRLGGNARVGALASRSPVRPVPLGLSAVELRSVSPTRIVVRGGDFLDGTPVLDLKPYLPWCDAIGDARADWAAEPPPRRPVRWSAAAEAALGAHPSADAMRGPIEAALALDPRPAYRHTGPDPRTYGMRYADIEVHFRCDPAGVEVVAVSRVTPDHG